MKKFLLSLLLISPAALICNESTENQEVTFSAQEMQEIEATMKEAGEVIGSYLKNLIDQGLTFEDAYKLTVEAVQNEQAPFVGEQKEIYIKILEIMIAGLTLEAIEESFADDLQIMDEN